MNPTDRSFIRGLDALAEVPEDRILLIGLDLTEHHPLVAQLSAIWPKAQVVSFTNQRNSSFESFPKSPLVSALVAARRLEATSVVALGAARKLLLLALAIPAERAFVFRGGRLEPLSFGSVATEQQLVVKTKGLVKRCQEAIAYSTMSPRLTTRFFIVSCGRNSGEAATRCLASVADQRYPSNLFEHLYIDDASSDDTDARIRHWLRDHPEHRVTYVNHAVRRGGTQNTRDGFRRAPAGSVVLELNGDDWLHDQDVLAWLDRVYSDPEVWMTYNSCVFADGRARALNRPYSPEVATAAAFREAPWYAGPLRSFRSELFTHIGDHELIDPTTGASWESADDQLVFLAMLELAGSRSRHVERLTYVYNHRETSEDAKDEAGSRAREQRVRQLPRRTPMPYLVPARRLGTPLISVLIPMYNAANYVSEAIAHVLAQDYDPFEVVIVDDGSTDGSSEIADRLAKQDPRVQVLHQPNRGIVAALQAGLRHARGDLIARMDADDRCPPSRISRQYALLKDNASWVAVGSWAARINAAGQRLKIDWRPPTSPGLIRWTLCFESCIPHGSALMWRSALERVGGYRTLAPHAEDYDLWIRLLEVGDLANVPDHLLELRIHEQRVGTRHDAQQGEATVQLSRQRIISCLGASTSEAVTQGLFALHHRRHLEDDPETLRTALLDLFETHRTDSRIHESDEILIRIDVANKLARLAMAVATSEPMAALRALGDARRIAPKRAAEILAPRLLQRVISD